MTNWRDYQFTVGMPHMVPNKLSEVELLKWLGAYQWESISNLLGCKAHEIASIDDERLYASFISVELSFPSTRTILAFKEGATVSVRNRVGVFGRRFVEGMLVFDCEPIEDATTDPIVTKADLAASARPWAYITNAFIARDGANTKLKIMEPRGMDGASLTLKSAPIGITEHQVVQGGGDIDADALPAGAIPLLPRGEGASCEIVYKISPESDLNGAGLLYFARYLAMMDFGTRRFLSEHLSRPISSALVECLSTEHRSVFYFVNADPWDSVRIFVRAWHLPASTEAPPSKEACSSRARFMFRLELYRASDGALMASSTTTKSLDVPDRDKSLVKEAARFLARLQRKAPP